MSCHVGGHRCSSKPALLWLWHRQGNYSSRLTTNLGTSICHRYGPKQKKKKKKLAAVSEIPLGKKCSQKDNGTIFLKYWKNQTKPFNLEFYTQ